jgi:hypothetical protein
MLSPLAAERYPKWENKASVPDNKMKFNPEFSSSNRDRKIAFLEILKIFLS